VSRERQDIWWEVLPEQAQQLPVELAQINAYLDDERFIAPWRELFADRTPATAHRPGAGEIDRLTGEIAIVARATLRDIAAVERNARRALGKQPSRQLRHLVGELAETVAGTRQLLEQSALRLAGIRTIPDRLVSLADPDARPIRKGKPQHPTQFGYTALVAKDERGFVVDHQVHRGNPPDATQLVPSVERVTTLTGWPPGTVVADRGFGTAANDRVPAELGVQRIGLQRKGTPGKADATTSAPARSDGCGTGESVSKPGSATSSAASVSAAPDCAAWRARRPGPDSGSSPTTSTG
jgi:hypothetical protein